MQPTSRRPTTVVVAQRRQVLPPDAPSATNTRARRASQKLDERRHVAIHPVSACSGGAQRTGEGSHVAAANRHRPMENGWLASPRDAAWRTEVAGAIAGESGRCGWRRAAGARPTITIRPRVPAGHRRPSTARRGRPPASRPPARFTDQPRTRGTDDVGATPAAAHRPRRLSNQAATSVSARPPIASGAIVSPRRTPATSATTGSGRRSRRRVVPRPISVAATANARPVPSAPSAATAANDRQVNESPAPTAAYAVSTRARAGRVITGRAVALLHGTPGCGDRSTPSQRARGRHAPCAQPCSIDAGRCRRRPPRRSPVPTADCARGAGAARLPQRRGEHRERAVEYAGDRRRSTARRSGTA